MAAALSSVYGIIFIRLKLIYIRTVVNLQSGLQHKARMTVFIKAIDYNAARYG